MSAKDNVLLVKATKIVTEASARLQNQYPSPVMLAVVRGMLRDAVKLLEGLP